MVKKTEGKKMAKILITERGNNNKTHKEEKTNKNKQKNPTKIHTFWTSAQSFFLLTA